ncbi:MAG: hypothetical protein IJZ94_03070 [Clostridia bacterium]|nr:hypothetical protein [Clostridia bacterium]
MKKTFYTELAYIIGIVFLAFGTSFTILGDFGLSVVVAPAYTVYLILSEIFPFFTVGMSEYVMQGVLIIILALIVRKFKKIYLYSFITALIYGMLLDLFKFINGRIFYSCGDILAVRIILFTVGIVIVAFGVASIFNTYITPEIYELTVTEISKKFNLDASKVKIGFDISMLLLTIILNLIFFRGINFSSIGIGTVVTAFVNGYIIGLYNKFLNKNFVFKDKFALRKYFE